MDYKKIENLKFLFSVNENDMRSIFMLIILNNLTDYTYKNLYDSAYMQLIKNNNEWIKYCMDLLLSNISITQFKANLPYTADIEKIIQTFFKLEYGSELIINVDQWKKVTRITRVNNKIIELTGICLTPNYIQSSNTQFTFNDKIIKSLLSTLIKNIPPIKCVETINPIVKCVINSEKLYLNYLEECFKGRGIDKCKRMMNEPNYLLIITKEVNEMDMCIAAETLVKFGFKSNKTKSICFESYKLWEKRMIQLLQVKQINPKLEQYLKLLLEKVNPIILLRKQLEYMNPMRKIYSIVPILNEYLHKYKLNYPITKYTNMETEYNSAYYIVSMYSLLIKVFNNEKHFNSNNRQSYSNYYDKIHAKLLLTQGKILDVLEQL